MTYDPDRDPRLPQASYTQFRLKLPAGATERPVAESLALRGHRWVIVGDGVVESLCVNPPSEPLADGFGWQDCELAAVEELVRAYGGYVGMGIEGSNPSPERRFLRDGRTPTLELDAKTALDRRRSAIAAFPVRQPEPPVAPPFEDEASSPALDFSAVIDDVSQRIYGDPQAALDVAGLGRLPDEGVPVSASDYLGALQDTVMHQDSCYPETAEAVPLLVALATHEGLAAEDRAYAAELLFSGASNGLRMATLIADSLVAQGVEFEMPEGAHMTREAVREHAGALFARWDREPGPVRMALAGLAAAVPEQAAGTRVLSGLAELAQTWPGTKRAAALRLALAAALDDDEAVLAEIAAIQAWHWQGPLAGGSPLAPPRARALRLLDDPEVR